MECQQVRHQALFPFSAPFFFGVFFPLLLITYPFIFCVDLFSALDPLDLQLSTLGLGQDVMNVCCALLWPDLPEEVAAQAGRSFLLPQKVSCRPILNTE